MLLGAILSMAVCLGAEGFPGIKPSHAAAIITLLDITTVFSQAQTDAQAMVARLSADNPRIPAEVWKHFSGQITRRETLERTYVPIYARHLPEEVAQGLIAFYHTPAGARLLQADPGIQTEFRRMVQASTLDIAQQILTVPPAARTTPPAADADESADPRTRAIHELLKVSGVLRTGQGVMFDMLDRLQKSGQGDTLPPEFWERARRRLGDEALLLKLWTPAYARFVPDADVQELIRFYRGPIGARFVMELPAIQRESTIAAVQLARSAAHGAIRDVLGPLPSWTLSHPHSAGHGAGGRSPAASQPPVWTPGQP